MTRSSHARRLACALCAVLPACSALGLDEFDLVRCDMPGKASPCAKLNDELPADQCDRYYCSESGYGCELRPRDDDGDHHPDATACRSEPDLRDHDLDCDDGDDRRYFGNSETCDGIDNDCNGWIDEQSVSDAAPHETEIEPGVERVAHVELAETLHLMLTHPAGPRSRQFETSHFTFSGGDLKASPALFGDGLVCAMRGQDENCNFTQLAIAATSDLLVAAGVHSQDCADGQLRVGTGSPSDLGVRFGAESTDDERSDSSSVAFGIDVNALKCTASGRCQGASDPAIAVLPAVDGLGAQALVVWRSAGGACAEDGSASVAVLGLFIEGDTSGSALLRGTADGHGEELGTSAGSGGPALAAFVGPNASSGYFVAYAGGARIELAFLPRLSDQSSATSAALFGNIDAAGADHVALTLSADPADAPRGLAAAYRIDTSRGPAIAFSQLGFDPDHTPHFAAAQPNLTFHAKGVISAGPSLVYAADGFSTDDAAGGGWLVAWVEQTEESGSSGERLMAVRIAEAALHPLGVVELAHGTIREPFTYFAPASSHGPSLNYGYVDDEKMRVGEVTCYREE